MRKRLLVVEDDSYILEALKELLESEGFDVECAKNGQEGIDRLAHADPRPNLILLDLMMPVKDGFEFRSEQLGDPELSGIPVVVLTAEGNRSERKTALRALTIVKKPVDIDRLMDVVNRACA